MFLHTPHKSNLLTYRMTMFEQGTEEIIWSYVGDVGGWGERRDVAKKREYCIKRNFINCTAFHQVQYNLCLHFEEREMGVERRWHGTDGRGT